MPDLAAPYALNRPAATAPARTVAIGLVLAALLLAVAGLSVGSEGWSFDWRADWPLIEAIRAPRTLGALLTGALLGTAGAIAQGLFRNPLADPYLLGAAAGAGLGVVLVLAAGGAFGVWVGAGMAELLLRTGLAGAAFGGALAGVALTLALARGAGRPMVLLLCGVVVGIVLGALSELVMLMAPEALRGKQIFLLGTTGLLGWPSVALLAAGLVLVLAPARRLARALDALVLGDASAASLGLPLPRVRLVLVALMALATGCAVSQAGLVAFVGLVAPHAVRRLVVVTHGPLLVLSALAGGVLLLAADIAARWLIAPQELPVGVLTAVLGGGYLFVLLRRRGRE
jgi:iron complex transport system permease protein